MKLITLCVNLYWNNRYTYYLCKSNKILFPLKHYPINTQYNRLPAFTLSTSSLLGFHTSSLSSAKSFQERENEYAHSIMEKSEFYKDTLVKLQSASDRKLPNPSASKELSNFAETSSGKRGVQESKSTHLIFSYGTLKKGEPNHDLITDSPEGKATFVGVARTVQKWPLIIASRYNIPYLLYSPGIGKHVIGELYEVDDIMLGYMDELECHPKYYTRVKAEVEVIQNSNYEKQCTFRCEKPWIYFLMNFRPHLLDLPYLEDYTSKGSHGLEYVSRYKRPKGEDYFYEVKIEKTSDPDDVYS